MTQEELLEQWEPKVHSMLRGVSIAGMQYEDIAQELRVVVIRVNQRWHEGAKASFHTYLHVAMQNELRTLMIKARRVTKDQPFLVDPPVLLRESPSFALEVGTVRLTGAEALLLDLLLCGYNLREIRGLCGGSKELLKVKARLRRRFSFLQLR